MSVQDGFLYKYISKLVIINHGSLAHTNKIIKIQQSVNFVWIFKKNK